MKLSCYTYIRDAIAFGYPLIEVLYNLLPLASEIVIVDCGSTDGTIQLLNELAHNSNIQIYHDKWTDGLGGRNYAQSANLCHKLCSYDTILFAEADEVWQESLIETTKNYLNAGNEHLKFWRFQLSQNFQRSPWYLEPDQVVPRIFKRGSCYITGGTTDKRDHATEVPLTAGYIVDCRNNFRDLYIAREQIAKIIWNDTARQTVRMVPAHINYAWEMTLEQAATELSKPYWTWTTTPFKIPQIMTWHLGKSTYQIRHDLVAALKQWQP